MREVYYEMNERSVTDKIIYLCSKFGFWILSAVSVVMFWAIRNFDFKIYNSNWLGYILLIIQVALIIFQIIMCNKYSDISKLKAPLINKWKCVYEKVADKDLEN